MGARGYLAAAAAAAVGSEAAEAGSAVTTIGGCDEAECVLYPHSAMPLVVTLKTSLITPLDATRVTSRPEKERKHGKGKQQRVSD
jgi:hypothetical protein